MALFGIWKSAGALQFPQITGRAVACAENEFAETSDEVCLPITTPAVSRKMTTRIRKRAFRISKKRALGVCFSEPWTEIPERMADTTKEHPASIRIENTREM